MISACQRDVAETLDAVGLAAHIAYALVQRARLLVERPRGIVIAAS
jgi:hypothetical protein